MAGNWTVQMIPAPNSNKLFVACDLEKYNEKRKEYDSLSKDEKGKYKGADDYVAKNGGPKLDPLNKNYKLLIDEINSRLSSKQVPEIFEIDSLSYGQVMEDLLSSLENEDHIKDVYKKKKLNVKSGLKTTDSTVIMECIRQGRSLLQAGLKAEMLAKPLIDFYAASAYAYAIIVLNSPLHKSIDSLKGSHGHTYNHTTSTIDFGGSIPSGTFLDLLCSMPITQIKNRNFSFKYPVLSSIDLVQNNTIKLSLLTLLSMVPELSVHLSHFSSDYKRIHKLNIDTGIVDSKITYNFYIGDGKDKPNLDKINLCFNTESVEENQGSYKVSIEADEISKIVPIIYQDLRGELWYVESPVDGLYLPEICLHFLIISALCNIMRYSPHEWSNILNNRISSQYSLLINQYIRLFEQKFPSLVIQYITNYLPILK